MPRSRHSSLTACSAGARIDGAGRVVRRHRHYCSRPRSDRAPDGVEIDLIVARRLGRNGARTRHHDRHLVVEVVRHEENDLVVWIGDREHRVHERLVAPSGHEYAAAGTHGDVVLARELVLERCDERRQAFNRAIAVISQLIAESTRGLDGLARRLIGNDPLPQRNRPRGFGGPASDDGDDWGLDGREAPRGLVEAASLASRHQHNSGAGRRLAARCC